MKKIVAVIVIIVGLAVGIGFAGYPFISNFLMSLNLNSEVQTYLNAAANLTKEQNELEMQKAIEYNKSLLSKFDIGDPFGEEIKADDDYYELVNLGGTSVMACIEVPALDINYPVYHGTSDEVLDKAIGHMRGTSLPVGGESTHAVLTGHSGYSTAKLFTDLDQLKKGDVFYITTLNQTLAYEVDQIKVVVPSDNSALKIEPNEDYVTLVTCTPYGVNSHRLLVRGTRVPYDEGKRQLQAKKRTESTFTGEYLSAILIGGSVMAGILIVYIFIRVMVKQVRKRKDNG